MKFGKHDMKFDGFIFSFFDNVRLYAEAYHGKYIVGDTAIIDIRNENHSQKRKTTCSTIYAIWFW